MTFSAIQDIKHKANLRQLINQTQDYAFNSVTFHQIYNEWPGDSTLASQYWSEASSGDGDGIIESNNEQFLAWKHLSLARMTKDQFDGVSQLPNSPLNNGSEYHFHQIPNNLYNIAENDLNGIHLLKDSQFENAISPIDAHLLDYKFDDANPADGQLLAFSNSANGCIVNEQNENVTMDYKGTGKIQQK